MAYDSSNVFAKILRGELPAHKVYEDADTLASMDIMPRAEGHTLVIPKAPVRNLLDASEAQLAACIRTVQRIAAAAKEAFAADGITLLQANEGAGGQVVFHLHFHVMDGPSPLGSNGLPFVFRSFDSEGTSTDDIDDLLAGQRAVIGPALAGPHQNQMPLLNQVVGFPAIRQ